jgi:hypothetical protein
MTNYHVKVTVRTADGKTSSYIKDNMTYSSKEEARYVAQQTFQNTPNVVQVEVFEEGGSQPVAFFH